MLIAQTWTLDFLLLVLQWLYNCRIRLLCSHITEYSTVTTFVLCVQDPLSFNCCKNIFLVDLLQCAPILIFVSTGKKLLNPLSHYNRNGMPI